MTAQHNFHELAAKHGFSVREIEKTCRISDTLRSFSEVDFLQKRLSLYGGTALNFIHAPQTLRLSVDLDLNYRHTDAKDWGEIRAEIDRRIKDLLYKKGYKPSGITIDPSYPLARITVQYTNSLRTRDSFKIEIGYMRRMPILKTDTTATFRHIGIGETFAVQTPIKEELFANKWCTMLFRKTPRDLFDVYQITRMKFDRANFRKCAIVESLMQEKQKLTEIDTKDTISRIPIDNSLRNLLQTEATSDYDFQKIKEQVTQFTEETISNITKDEARALGQFFDHLKFEPSLIDDNSILNERIDRHPAILRTLQKLTQKRDKDREERL